jgi:Uma2 family endonuclease
MSALTVASDVYRPRFAGLRLSAKQYFSLPDDEYHYELIDGVVVVSPTPIPLHQLVVGEIHKQLAVYLDQHEVGTVFLETDVHMGKGKSGRDIVYCPELAFFAKGRFRRLPERLVGPPNMVLEVISPGSRSLDLGTKRDDYERFRVAEYWLVDPKAPSFTVHTFKSGRFVARQIRTQTFTSAAVPGFELDWRRVRQLIETA